MHFVVFVPVGLALMRGDSRYEQTTAPTAVQRWMVMGMADRCENCTEKCPQAEMAHQAALGRMYATKEFIAILKKVESGELVEVVRCKDCKWYAPNHDGRWFGCAFDIRHPDDVPKADDFCSYGERRSNG